jgi:hypothetical protein
MGHSMVALAFQGRMAAVSRNQSTPRSATPGSPRGNYAGRPRRSVGTTSTLAEVCESAAVRYASLTSSRAKR